MFLKKHPNLGRKHPRTGRVFQLPYDGLITGENGKREVVDDMVHMIYSFKRRQLIDGKQRERSWAGLVKLPVDLVVKMARATLRDAKAVKRLDNQLRAIVKEAPPGPKIHGLDKAFLDGLEANVDEILDQNENPRSARFLP
ncbi:MAG: hypothetical protein O7E52_14595 [Candidatus Poribacteria bacterium]|nr:hypothetical protein [Candidatus Poribacteria bacterium]